jgi:hypothetical protein
MASPPAAPTPFAISRITNVSVTGDINLNGTGGLLVDQYQIGYGTSSSAPVSYYTVSGMFTSGTTTVPGLNAKTTYYFWARVHTSAGWSPLSARTSAKTYDAPDAPTSVALSQVTQTSVFCTFTDNAINGSNIVARQIGYGQNSTAPITTINSDGTTAISGLTPGIVYYFWARSSNEYGYGPWSVRTSVRTAAGMKVNVNGVWKDAVPYVRVSGVWVPAEPWAKLGGVWRKYG